MKISKYIPVLILCLGSFISVYSQRPTHSPKPDRPPVDFTQPVNIIVFIILPILLVIFYILWRNKKRKDEGEQE